MRNRIGFRTPSTAAMQPWPALRSSGSTASSLGVALAGKTTMQIVTTTQHGQAARLPHQKEQTRMKMNISTLVALALGLGAFTILAQDQGGGPGGPGGPHGHGGRFGGPPHVGPLMVALDG